MSDQGRKEDEKSWYSRREFLKFSGTVAVGLGVGGLTNLLWTADGIAAIKVSGGYLLVDTKKCQGCQSCMLACSLVHEGDENLSLSRIQILQNPFMKWPGDLTIEQCRQCVDPPCVEACPTGALGVDAKHGYVRMVNRDKCIADGSCVEACPFPPSRLILAEDPKYKGKLKARKCDLCVNTPYWDQKGGPGGKQACVEVCPLGAIAFTAEVPEQKGDAGYKVNLRDKNWASLGYPEK